MAGLVPAKKSAKHGGRYDPDAAARRRSVNEITKLSTRTNCTPRAPANGSDARDTLFVSTNALQVQS
jgi:hypothetical protein